jgi:hypothetical protein
MGGTKGSPQTRHETNPGGYKHFKQEITVKYIFRTGIMYCSLEKSKRSCPPASPTVMDVIMPIKVPKCEIFYLLFFYMNKSCLYGLFRDWGTKFVILRIEADIRNVVF